MAINAGVALIVSQKDKICRWTIAKLVAIAITIVKELNTGAGVHWLATNVEDLIEPSLTQISLKI